MHNMVSAPAATGNSEINAFLSLAIGLIALQTAKVDFGNASLSCNLWLSKIDQSHPKMQRTMQKALAVARAEKINTLRGATILCELGTYIKDNWAKFQRNTSVTDKQIALLSVVGLYLRNGNEVYLPKIEKQVGILQQDVLCQWFRAPVADQSELDQNLRFIVKQHFGRKDNRLTLDEYSQLAETKPEIKAKYNQFRRIGNESYKTLLRNLVREKGQVVGPTKLINAGDVKQAIKTAGLKIYNFPTGFEGKLDENGSLYTAQGRKLLVKGMTPGSEICMNLDYDPKRDDSYYFKYLPPGGKGWASALTENYKKTHRDVKKYGSIQQYIDLAKAKQSIWLKDLFSANPARQIMGAAVELLHEGRIRVSAREGSTDDKPTYGLTTLQVRHVNLLANGAISLVFDAKSAMRQKLIIKPDTEAHQKIIALLTKLILGKKPTALVWQFQGEALTAQMINQYMKNNLQLPFTAKQFRTNAGTKMMGELLQANPLKANVSQKEAELWYKALAEDVGKHLGHFRVSKGQQLTTGTTSIQSYISPKLSNDFFAKRGLRTPKWLGGVE